MFVLPYAVKIIDKLLPNRYNLLRKVRGILLTWVFILSYNFFGRIRSSHQRCSIEKALKNFEIFSGKQLCWSLFLIKLQAWRPATLLRWLLGLRKLRSSKKVEILQVTRFARCIMKKHYFLSRRKETAFFSLLSLWNYLLIMFYCAELFECSFNFKFC